MKLLTKIMFLASILLQGCFNQKDSIHQFSSSEETIVIPTKAHKGGGLFSNLVVPLSFLDTAEQFPYTVVFPDNISDIKRSSRFVDLKAMRYNNYTEERKSSLQPYIHEDIVDQKLDTLNCPNREQNYINVMKGLRGSEKVFIVDENNNKDFNDDSVRTYLKIDWYSSRNLIKCKFDIYNGDKVVTDSTWVNIGTLNSSSKLFFGVFEYLTADFSIDDDNFQIGISDEEGGFPYQFPTISLLSNNSKTKDTLLLKDILYRGEFVKLNDAYYRFDNISNSGDYLTLVKEGNFELKIGTQVDMVAPEFECITVNGDTVRSTTLHDRIMVIANSCGCGGDQVSTKAYDEISEEFDDKIHILHLDSQIEEGLEGLRLDMEDDFNSDIYDKYRNAYCSRICYVIDEDSRIIDKFPVTSWKTYLPKHIKS